MDLEAITYTSETFEIYGEELRLRWNAKPVFINSWIHIDVMYANGTRYAYRVSSGYSGYSCDMRIVEPGEYYLEVQTFLMDYFSVTVWDYY